MLIDIDLIPGLIRECGITTGRMETSLSYSTVKEV